MAGCIQNDVLASGDRLMHELADADRGDHVIAAL